MHDLAVQLDGAELGGLRTCRGPLDHRVRTLAVVVIDPIEPGRSFALCLVAGIPSVPVIPTGLTLDGTGDGGRRGWQPPGTSPGNPAHQLTVKVYALDDVPAFAPGFARPILNEAIRGHILQVGSPIAFVR
ncbi:MAG: hypothetical protein ABFC89_03495 [Methanospirillum sp.]